ncbi:MAG TPA: Gfo/Idh/MocA family oxidoreductase [Chitinophagaceae bacterium]|nr:Gfo/Idh/MocA family oxidoreductase [Chitinophagaceae bacterium]
MFKSSFAVFLLILALPMVLSAQSSSKPVRVAVVGLVHDHVHWILGRKNRGDIEVVGYAEANTALADKYAKQYGINKNLFYTSMEEMIEKTKPEAVLAFNSIYDHLKVVEYCAPRGVHVMVEKPLAVSLDHANKMLALAKKHKIYLLTNYETTWYGSNEMAYKIALDNKSIGDIRKIVFYTGHRGPREIGCSEEFLAWLTDPVQNGAGALNDFGCYGADLATWLLKGEKPVSVFAVTQQIKPDLYPKVDDEATIVISYPKSQVVIQASWNWPYNRKEMELYGRTGYVFCKDGTNLIYRESEKTQPQPITAAALPEDRNDPFVYFANVIRGKIKLSPWDLSSTETNEMVVKILDAAKRSAKSGKAVTIE